MLWFVMIAGLLVGGGVMYAVWRLVQSIEE